jgi:hypothetical protein
MRMWKSRSRRVPISFEGSPAGVCRRASDCLGEPFTPTRRLVLVVAEDNAEWYGGKSGGSVEGFHTVSRIVYFAYQSECGDHRLHVRHTPGQVELSACVHRAVNVGKKPYEQVTVFRASHGIPARPSGRGGAGYRGIGFESQNSSRCDMIAA